MIRANVMDCIMVDEQCVYCNVLEESAKRKIPVIATTDKIMLGLPDRTNDPVDAIVDDLVNFKVPGVADPYWISVAAAGPSCTWPGSGVWVKYSASNSWTQLSIAIPNCITTARFTPPSSGTARGAASSEKRRFWRTDPNTGQVVAYEPTLSEQLRDEQPLTQFGRAMRELGVSIVPAYSPQAKGRVERRNGLFQDRLVKALRLANELRVDSVFINTRALPFRKGPGGEHPTPLHPFASEGLTKQINATRSRSTLCAIT
jgi:hypothetical protein